MVIFSLNQQTVNDLATSHRWSCKRSFRSASPRTGRTRDDDDRASHGRTRTERTSSTTSRKTRSQDHFSWGSILLSKQSSSVLAEIFLSEQAKENSENGFFNSRNTTRSNHLESTRTVFLKVHLKLASRLTSSERFIQWLTLLNVSSR